jgi:peroxiredoxin
MNKPSIRSASSITAFPAFMAVLAAILAHSPVSEAAKAKFNKVLSVGEAAPDWADLPGVDDKSHSLADYREAKIVVVVFTCNHCPVAKMYEDRLMNFARKFDQKVQVIAISVSHNGADGLEKMKGRAAERGMPYPYL